MEATAAVIVMVFGALVGLELWLIEAHYRAKRRDGAEGDGEK
jgi:hypothetical protein